MVLSGLRCSYLVIPFTKKLEFLGLFVHENSLQVSCVGRPQFNGLFSPTHHLVRLKVGWRGGGGCGGGGKKQIETEKEREGDRETK